MDSYNKPSSLCGKENCNQETRFELLYTKHKDDELEVPEYETHERVCAEHVRDIGFVFCPIHGMPDDIDDIIDLSTTPNIERPDLVEELNQLYEE